MPPLPPRVIPWGAVIITVLFTLNAGHTIYKNMVEKDQVAARIEVLDAQVNDMTAKAQELPKTVTIERHVTKEIPEPAYALKKDERGPADGTKPLAMPPPSPRTYTEVQRKTVPNPEHAEVEQKLRETRIEIEAESFKFKMINEATWSMVFKVCFLWGFLLLTLGLYRRFSPRSIST